jgi:hypothetical protein
MSTHLPEGKNLEEELSSAPTQVKVEVKMSAVERLGGPTVRKKHIYGFQPFLCMQERK